MKNSENYSVIKNKITDISGTQTKKFRDTVKSKSYTRFFFLTNELESIRTDTDETRFFYLNVKKETDSEQLDKLLKLTRKVKKSNTLPILFGKLLEKCDFPIYNDRTEWSKNVPITKTSNMFKSMSVIEQFLSNFVSNTLNIKNLKLKTNEYVDYDEANKVILKIEEDEITFSLNKLYILFTYFYTGNNTKKTSFCKETFKTNFINIYGSLVDYKKDRGYKEEILKINKTNLLKKLIDLKIIEKQEITDDFINIYYDGEYKLDVDLNKKMKNVISKINKKIMRDDKKRGIDNIFEKIKDSIDILKTEIDLKS